MHEVDDPEHECVVGDACPRGEQEEAAEEDEHAILDELDVPVNKVMALVIMACEGRKAEEITYTASDSMGCPTAPLDTWVP